ncbi:MAG: hypothetical protein ACRC8S_17695 [Fimbriiglobus sp.]
MLFGKSLMESTEFLLTVALLMGVLLGGAIALHLANLWRSRREARAGQDMETLNEYREMYENGELNEEEYKQIRDRVAGRLKNLPTTSQVNSAETTEQKPLPPEDSKTIS